MRVTSNHLSILRMTNAIFFEHADICDSEDITRIFNEHQPDAVMHLLLRVMWIILSRDLLPLLKRLS